MNPYVSPGLFWPPEVNKVITEVTKLYGLQPSDILISTRKQPIAEARQHVVYRLKRDLKYTNRKAAGIVGFKELSTATYANKVIKNRIRLNQLWFQLKRKKNGKKIY